MSAERPGILVLGASGLIGQAAATGLSARGFPVAALARRFAPGQASFLDRPLTCPVVDLDPAALEDLLRAEAPDVVVNCIGVLQDTRSGTTEEVHRGFARRLTAAIAALERPALLVHLSVPGEASRDLTAFSRSKHDADEEIAWAGIAFAILRPGFVVAPTAYGGSALVRALAALPVDLPAEEARSPFRIVAIEDVVATVARLAERWHRGELEMRLDFDLMHPEPHTVGSVVSAFRRRGGAATGPRTALPGWLLTAGAWAGDLAAKAGWRPPVRSTALAEMRRGVEGDPAAWIAWIGIEPTPLEACLAALSSVQERWFARLYLLKPAILAPLALFWIASGLIALTVAFGPARDILVGLGMPGVAAGVATLAFSLLDVAIGVGIAFRRSARAALWAGIVLTGLYILGAAVFSPVLWLDPLGAMVKTLPVMLLMAVALAILPDR